MAYYQRTRDLLRQNYMKLVDLFLVLMTIDGPPTLPPDVLCEGMLDIVASGGAMVWCDGDWCMSYDDSHSSSGRRLKDKSIVVARPGTMYW